MISITINVSEICLCSWLNIFWGPCVWPGYCLLLYRLVYVDQLAFLHCTALLCQGWVKDKWFRARWLFSKSSIHNILNPWNSSVSYMYCALEHCTAFNFILQFTQISNAPIVTQNLHLQAHRRADARANLLVAYIFGVLEGLMDWLLIRLGRASTTDTTSVGLGQNTGLWVGSRALYFWAIYIAVLS